MFAAKLTEVLRKLESGSYAVVERGGMRQYKVPQRDKPTPLQKERLRCVECCSHTATVQHLIISAS